MENEDTEDMESRHGDLKERDWRRGVDEGWLGRRQNGIELPYSTLSSPPKRSTLS